MIHEPPHTSFFLLRGLAREIRHWGDFPNLLAQKKPGCRSIPLEIPGAGKLRNTCAPLTVSRYVQEIRGQYLPTVRQQDRNVIVGLSFGGMIAAKWLGDFPGDFDGAILINISSQFSPASQRLRPSAAACLLRALFYRKTLEREKTIAQVICNLADTTMLARAWQKISDSAPAKRRNILRQLYAAATFKLPNAPDVPVLLLGSNKDKLVHHSCTRRIAEAWQIELISHSQAGHDLPTDDPNWCCETVFSWMKKVFGD